MILGAVCILTVGFYSAHAQQADNLLVTTTKGLVRGRYRQSQLGASYRSFEGIPFAAPPVGRLRFAPPQPAEPWEGELDVSGAASVKCVQYGYMSEGGSPGLSGSEDCLYLNVWTPANRSDESLAVMMWIYGGSFTAGSNQFLEYGPMRFMDQDVIIVSPLYRLGPFGFTSLGIDEAPGNQAFLDLVASLQWIQDNIANFGGDPERVTIFGESSGSWAVSYLTLTPLANGLFHRAIMQSGGVFNPYWLWRTKEDAVGLSTFLSTTLQCPSVAEDPLAALECLQNLPVEDIESSINWGTEETLNIQKILRPTGVIDGSFLPDNPVKLMERGDFNHVDLMVGMTKDEGLLQTYQLELHPELYFLAALGWDIFGPMFLFGRFGNYDITQTDRDMSEELTRAYLGEGGRVNFNKEHFQNITDMLSDAYIWYGGHKQAAWAAAYGDNVYQYMFTFKGTYGFADAFGLDNSLYGVCHADELYYFWKPYWKKGAIQLKPEEEVLSSRLLLAWTTFAKTGSPRTPGPEIPWDPVLPENHQYLNIGEDLTMEHSPQYVDRMNLWDEVYQFPEGNTLPYNIADLLAQTIQKKTIQ